MEVIVNEVVAVVRRGSVICVEYSKKVSKLASNDCGSIIPTSIINNKLFTQVGVLGSKTTMYANVVRNNVGRKERVAVSPSLRGELTGSKQPISS